MIISFLYIIVIFSVFQNFSIPIGNSQIDISNLMFMIFVILLTIVKKIKFRLLNLALILAFGIVQIILIEYFKFNILRSYFNLILLFIYMLYLWGSHNVHNMMPLDKYNKNLYSLLCVLGLFVASTILIQTYRFDFRPYGTFYEPSGAGLFIVSCLIMVAGKFLLTKNFNIYDIFLAGFLSSALALTLTAHILSGFITLALTIITIKLNKNKLALFLTLSFIPISFIVIIAGEHLASRVIFSENNLNYSQLAWLQGFDQFYYVLLSNPVTGFGLGATGYFPFNSDASNALALSPFPSLNLKDAYSGFFRIFIGGGVVLLALITVPFCIRFVELCRMRGFNESEVYHICIFLFGICMLVGILLKEPSYTRSFWPLALICGMTPSSKRG